jgi:hypothetical protein
MTSKTAGIFLLWLVFATAFSAFHLIAPVKAAAPQIEFVYHYGFYMSPPVGPYGVYNVIGEVQNVGDAPASQINVTVTYYDQAGVPLNTTRGQTYIECLLPGLKAPFRHALSHSNVLSVVNYSVSISSVVQGDGKPLNLQIVNSTFYTKDGILKTPGTVKNNGFSNAMNTKVVAIYYNKTTGNIFWTSRALASSSNLTYGGTTRFEISSQPKDIVPEKCRLVFVAESDEYLSQPFENLVRDTIKPQIGEPKWSPTNPTFTQIVSVSVNVTKPDYASKITKVLICYQVGGGAVTKINMTASGNLWKTPLTPPIGPFSAGKIVQFYIEAYDEAGNPAESPPYSFTVQGQPPSSGVPPEALLIALIVLILLGVIYKYRKRLF